MKTYKQFNTEFQFKSNASKIVVDIYYNRFHQDFEEAFKKTETILGINANDSQQRSTF